MIVNVLHKWKTRVFIEIQITNNDERVASEGQARRVEITLRDIKED